MFSKGHVMDAYSVSHIVMAVKQLRRQYQTELAILGMVNSDGFKHTDNATIITRKDFRWFGNY